MARTLVFALCMALLVPPGTVIADSPEAPVPGIRVRITAPHLSSRPLIGTLTALEGDALSLSLEGRPEPITVPRTAVTKWEVSQGRQSHAGRGALWGLLAGAAAGVALAAADDADGGWYAVAGAFCGGAGAGVGALVGSLHKTERWEEVEKKSLRIGVVPLRDGVGFSVEWSFGGGGSRSR